MSRLPILQTLAVSLAVIGTAKGADHFRGFGAEARPAASSSGWLQAKAATAPSTGPGAESPSAYEAPAAPVPVVQTPTASETAAPVSGSAARLSQIYAAVPPETAARILAGLPPRDAADILLSMKEAQAAQVLSAMDTDAAVALTMALSGKDHEEAR